MGQVKKNLWMCGVLVSLSVGCGTEMESSDPKIVGGRQVLEHESGPERRSTVGLSGCTGTIIAKDLILTAAHCYQNAMRGGYVLFGAKFSGNQRTTIKIAEGRVNPQYRAASDTDKDIAVLRLAQPIPQAYQPIKMLPASVRLLAGDAVRLVGYGSTNEPSSFGTLRTVESKFVSQSASGSIFIRNGQSAACSGDSGGPLYVFKNQQWHVAGVTSTAIMDANRRCTGGNYYSSTSTNQSLILSMARALTKRQNPLL